VTQKLFVQNQCSNFSQNRAIRITYFLEYVILDKLTVIWLARVYLCRNYVNHVLGYYSPTVYWMESHTGVAPLNKALTVITHRADTYLPLTNLYLEWLSKARGTFVFQACFRIMFWSHPEHREIIAVSKFSITKNRVTFASNLFASPSPQLLPNKNMENVLENWNLTKLYATFFPCWSRFKSFDHHSF